MAYMDQDRKAKVVAAVKPLLKKYRLKGTFSVRNHSTIVLTITEGVIDFIGNYNETISPNGRAATTSLDVNPYWYQDHFTGVAKKALAEIMPAMKSADWYDRSDAQVDYFDTAYYVDVNVGKWNKPYRVVS
jgi:hypothetical protein